MYWDLIPKQKSTSVLQSTGYQKATFFFSVNHKSLPSWVDLDFTSNFTQNTWKYWEFKVDAGKLRFCSLTETIIQYNHTSLPKYHSKQILFFAI